MIYILHKDGGAMRNLYNDIFESNIFCSCHIPQVSTVIEHLVVIARAYTLTVEGKAWEQANKKKVHSTEFLCNLISQTNDQSIESILLALNSSTDKAINQNTMKPYSMCALKGATEYFKTTWHGLDTAHQKNLSNAIRASLIPEDMSDSEVISYFK